MAACKIYKRLLVTLVQIRMMLDDTTATVTAHKARVLNITIILVEDSPIVVDKISYIIGVTVQTVFTGEIFCFARVLEFRKHDKVKVSESVEIATLERYLRDYLGTSAPHDIGSIFRGWVFRKVCN